MQWVRWTVSPWARQGRTRGGARRSRSPPDGGDQLEAGVHWSAQPRRLSASVRRYSARRRNAMRIGGACTPSRRRTRNCTGAKAGIGNTVKRRLQRRNRHRGLVAEVLAVRLGQLAEMRRQTVNLRPQAGAFGLYMVVAHKVVVGVRHGHKMAGHCNNRRYLPRGDACIRSARPDAEQPHEQHAGRPSA